MSLREQNEIPPTKSIFHKLAESSSKRETYLDSKKREVTFQKSFLSHIEDSSYQVEKINKVVFCKPKDELETRQQEQVDDALNNVLNLPSIENKSNSTDEPSQELKTLSKFFKGP